MRRLFERLLAAGTEDEVQAIPNAEGLASDDTKWTPYGNNEAFYGVVENQQAHPVPALVEKVINGIDAILEKKVLQELGDRTCPRVITVAPFERHRTIEFIADDLNPASRRPSADLQSMPSRQPLPASKVTIADLPFSVSMT